jgi:glycine reductase
VVILITPIDKLDNNKYEQTVRTAGFKAAAYLGKAGAKVNPDEKEVFKYDPITEAVRKYPDLPRIIHVCMLATYSTIYGLDVRGVLPTIISPLEVIDGILVGGLLSGASHRDTTYHHSRNPVIFELLRRHGKDLCFMGVILTNQLHVLIGKERSSFFVSQIAKIVGAQGAIITKDGAGNPDTDLMLNCRNLEKSGIKTVLITDEVCGRDGASLGLADAAHEANATISTGNVNELLALPPMDRVIGFLETVETISGGFHGSLHKDGSLTVETGAILGSLCQLGFEKITTKVK